MKFSPYFPACSWHVRTKSQSLSLSSAVVGGYHGLLARHDSQQNNPFWPVQMVAIIWFDVSRLYSFTALAREASMMATLHNDYKDSKFELKDPFAREAMV